MSLPSMKKKIDELDKWGHYKRGAIHAGVGGLLMGVGRNVGKAVGHHYGFDPEIGAAVGTALGVPSILKAGHHLYTYKNMHEKEQQANKATKK